MRTPYPPAPQPLTRTAEYAMMDCNKNYIGPMLCGPVRQPEGRYSKASSGFAGDPSGAPQTSRIFDLAAKP